jgi:hypothetical protein
LTVLVLFCIVPNIHVGKQERRLIMTGDKLNGFEELADGMPSMPPALELDHGKYMDELESFDLTDAQKRELLETLWSIMRSFVELGFRADDCGQVLGLAALASTESPDGVDSRLPSSATETPDNER